MDNKIASGSERRQFFRVIYNEKYHPVLLIRNIEFEVIDISETGVRFKLKEKVKLPGDLFHAKVQLHNDELIEVMGRIIRITGDQAAMLMVVKKIPYQFILSEQAFLRQQTES
jgi:hypothetical protein